MSLLRSGAGLFVEYPPPPPPCCVIMGTCLVFSLNRTIYKTVNCDKEEGEGEKRRKDIVGEEERFRIEGVLHSC